MIHRFTPQAFEPLDEEEQLLMEAMEEDGWEMVAHLEAEKAHVIEAARHTIRKDKRINLRLTPKDYHEIQVRAIEEGIPYQTLISSLVHKYLNGQLVPRETAPE